MKRARIFLEDGDFKAADEYAERVLDKDPECAEAYLVKLLAQLKLKLEEELGNGLQPLTENSLYQKACRYSQGAMKQRLTDYNSKRLAAAEAKIKAAEAATNSIGMKLVELPAGMFTMGSPVGERREYDEEEYDEEEYNEEEYDEEQVAVTLTKPFWLGKTEVTQGQFQKVMGTSPWLNQPGVQIGEGNAASYVSWDDATAFCQKLTDLERKAGKLQAGESYRLPTEAEWEYACRAGTTTAYSFDDDEEQLDEYGWFKGNTKNEQYAHKVGLKKPNPWGLHDMHGNVYEWCSDWYGSGLSGGTDPTGPGGGSSRVVRSGSWGSLPDYCRSAYRDDYGPSFRDYRLGFRVARSQSAQ